MDLLTEWLAYSAASPKWELWRGWVDNGGLSWRNTDPEQCVVYTTVNMGLLECFSTSVEEPLGKYTPLFIPVQETQKAQVCLP